MFTAQRRDPSFFQLRLVMVYKLGMSLGLASSHTPLLGAQLYTRSLSDTAGRAAPYYHGAAITTGRAPVYLPVKTAEHNRLPAGAAARHGELLLRGVAAVVECLQNVAVSAVGHNLLIAAAHHDAVCTPGQSVGGAWVFQQLPLSPKQDTASVQLCQNHPKYERRKDKYTRNQKGYLWCLLVCTGAERTPVLVGV